MIDTSWDSVKGRLPNYRLFSSFELDLETIKKPNPLTPKKIKYTFNITSTPNRARQLIIIVDLAKNIISRAHISEAEQKKIDCTGLLNIESTDLATSHADGFGAGASPDLTERHDADSSGAGASPDLTERHDADSSGAGASPDLTERHDADSSGAGASASPNLTERHDGSGAGASPDLTERHDADGSGAAESPNLTAHVIENYCKKA